MIISQQIANRYQSRGISLPAGVIVAGGPSAALAGSGPATRPSRSAGSAPPTAAPSKAPTAGDLAKEVVTKRELDALRTKLAFEADEDYGSFIAMAGGDEGRALVDWQRLRRIEIAARPKPRPKGPDLSVAAFRADEDHADFVRVNGENEQRGYECWRRFRRHEDRGLVHIYRRGRHHAGGHV